MRDVNYPDNRTIKSRDGIKTIHLFHPMVFELSDRILIITTWKRVSRWKRARFSQQGFQINFSLLRLIPLRDHKSTITKQVSIDVFCVTNAWAISPLNHLLSSNLLRASNLDYRLVKLCMQNVQSMLFYF